MFTSIELEDPLLGEDERRKKQAVYDHVADLAQRYRRGELAQQFPGLREVYATLGWNYDDDGPNGGRVSDPAEPKGSELTAVSSAEPEPEKNKSVNLSAWLDDD